jgi:tetratricopeptide (TPR) repeat protein
LNDCDSAVELNPHDPVNLADRGAILLNVGKLDRAVADFTRALQIQPTNGLLHEGLARSYSTRGDFQQAVKEFHETVRLGQDQPAVCNSLAWLLATCPDASVRNGKEAVGLARKACVFTSWEHRDYIDTLASALAEAGDFEAAVSYQKQAVAMAKDSADRAELQQHLELYEKRQPYRDVKKSDVKVK